MKPLFKVVKEQPRKEIEGDFVVVSKKKAYVEFNAGLYTSTLTQGEKVNFELTPKDGSLMAKLSEFFDKTGLTQGYIACDSGILNDMTCAFFLTKHKPSPTFGKAFFKGENIVISISGFFLSIPIPKGGKQKSTTVPHVHIVFQNKETGKTFSGHLVDSNSGKLKCSLIPLSGKTLKRETDPNTGGMYLRTDKKEDIKLKVGDSMLFAFGPREDFPNKLFKLLSTKGIKKAKFSFAVGTLQWAEMKDLRREHLIKPREGLELVFTAGEVTFRDNKFAHNTKAHLTDRYGNQYVGQLTRSKVKDLVEGILELES